MKIYKSFTVLALGLLLTALQTVYGQQQNGQGSQVPDCNVQVAFTATGSTASFDNRSGLCANWAFSYTGTGFSALSVVVQSAPDNNGVPGTWVTYAGTVSVGVNPNTTITQNTVRLEGFFPWMRVTLSSVTGTGSVRGRLYGYRYVSNRVVPGAPPIGAAGGALSGTYPNPVLVGVVAGQVAYGSAVAGVLGSEAQFTYSAASDLLQVGGNGLSPIIRVVGPGGSFQGFVDSTPTKAYRITTDASGHLYMGVYNGSSWNDSIKLANATGNLLLGTTTDDATNKLQVAGDISISSSGSGVAASLKLNQPSVGALYIKNRATTGSFEFLNNNSVRLFEIGNTGTSTFYSEIPTTGVTQLIVRAGAGQASTNLQTWQSSAAATIAAVGSTGRVFAPRFTTLVDSGWALQDDFDATFPLLLASGRGVGWSSTTSFAGTKDLSLSRASAGTLQVGDGGSNANGKIAANIGLFGGATDDGVNKLQVAGNISATSAAGGEMVKITGTAGSASFLSVGSTEGNIILQDSGATANQQAYNLNSNDGVLNFRLLNDARTGVIGTFAKLNSVGQWYFMDDRATVGSTLFTIGYNGTSASAVFTQLIVRAGTGQSTTNLQTWQNAAGTTISQINSNGNFDWYTGGNRLANYGGSAILASTGQFAFSSTSTITGTQDLTLDRQAAGVLRISNTGTTGGGLLIEALKSTTGVRYVCVDTTGRITSQAAACVGT